MKSHLDRLRFRHLLMLESLGETRSLRKTAEQLGLTQPGCSKLLRELELELGTVLFERTPAGVSPTPYGEVMLRTAHLIIAQANSALQEMETLAGGSYVRVRVGMFGVALSGFVAEVVQKIRAASSSTLVALEEGSAELLLAALRKGDLECVIGRGGQGGAVGGLRQVPLFFENVRVVAKPDHCLARRKGISLAQLAQLNWVLPAPGTVLRQRLETLFAQQRLPMPRCYVESSVYTTNQALLPLGDGVMLFPERLASTLETSGTLSILDVPLPLELPAVSLWLRDAAAFAPAVDSFIREAKSVAVNWS
ncbi:LysR substrate-binding domain-containing protein [Ramlibacter sp. AN1133]|uniref:LysR substrate-binding domain-containing protein n=1 Tax=Ramlibacter sp. AN1133 TaxID=3133429 RepID=UPI0030C4D48B